MFFLPGLQCLLNAVWEKSYRAVTAELLFQMVYIIYP